MRVRMDHLQRRAGLQDLEVTFGRREAYSIVVWAFTGRAFLSEGKLNHYPRLKFSGRSLKWSVPYYRIKGQVEFSDRQLRKIGNWLEKHIVAFAFAPVSTNTRTGRAPWEDDRE